MNIENIFDDIRFKVSPSDDYRSSYKFRFIKSFYKIFKKEKNYVFDNCIINKGKIDLDLKKELIKIDSMSTYAIGYLINRICKNLSKNQVYLNIGCWKGFSLVAGMINTECKVIGVDNFSQFTGPKNDFLKNFENSKKKIIFFLSKIMRNILSLQTIPKINLIFIFMTENILMIINLKIQKQLINF